MKRKKKKALILSVFMILLLAACSSRTNVRDGDDYIYCLNPDKTGLVKVSYEVQGEDVVEEAKDILREMQKPADETRYTPAISKKIKVQDCKLRGSILDVDFNSEYRSVKPLEEKLMRAAIVQSLLRLDGVNAVSLSVDGEPLKNADGAVIGLMNEDDFVENTGSSLSSYQSGTLTLYGFPDFFLLYNSANGISRYPSLSTIASRASSDTTYSPASEDTSSVEEVVIFA